MLAARIDNRIIRWTFTLGAERLELDRVEPTEIIVTFSGAAPQVMRFADIVEAVLFQTDLETELVRTGWTLSDFQSSRAVDPLHPELPAATGVATDGSA